MADSEKNVSARDPLRISAATWNQLMDMLRWYNREGRKVKGSPMTDLLKTNTEIYVQNLTGLTWDTAYKVVRLSNSLIPLNNDNRERVNKDPILGAFVPLSEVDAIGITQKPSDSAPSNGLIVPTVIHGVTIARVKMLDEGHTWANPVSGVIDYLESSAECGQARILYHVADGDESLAIVNLIGAGPCDVTFDSGESGGTGSRSDGPGWIAGLCANNCLKMRVMEIHGLCAGIDLDQVIPLEGDGTTWTSVCDFEYCNSVPGSEEGSNDCRDTGIVTFTKDASIGLPKATIDDIQLFYHRAANGWVEFAGGGELCGGCPEPTEESGPCGPIDATGGNCCGPNGGCGSNYFIVRFECAEACVIDGWDCPAWYCVTSDPECCDGSAAGAPQPMFVDGDAATDPALHICSGPYDTEEEANDVCGEFVCEAVPGGYPSCGSISGSMVTGFDCVDACLVGGAPFPGVDPVYMRNYYQQTVGYLTIDLVDPQPGQEIRVYTECDAGGVEGQEPALAVIDASNPHFEYDIDVNGPVILLFQRPYNGGFPEEQKMRVCIS